MILVVDDDKNIRLSLKLILERNAYEVALAEGPKEAMQIVRNTPAVELVLMDMNYTRATDGEEGLTLLKQVKVFRPEAPCTSSTATAPSSPPPQMPGTGAAHQEGTEHRIERWRVGTGAWMQKKMA